jgi:hypothetical protein
MESAAQAEDYETALTKCTDLTTKVDVYIQAVKDLEEKKQQYEQALEVVKPKLDEAGQKTVYNKLAPQKQEYESLNGEMETAAQAEDYEIALAKCTNLTGRVNTYLQDVEKLEKSKQEYETAKGTVQQQLDGIAQSNHPKLAPKKQAIETLKGQLDSAARTEDYETALAKANELIAKIDEYAIAAKELAEKEKQFNQGNEALKPKLDEAAKAQHPDAANLQTLRSQMETAAQNGDYDQALKSQEELKAKVANILAAPKEAPQGIPDGKPGGGGSQGDPAPQAAKPWSEMAPLCEKFLDDRNFRAVESNEAVPGDMVYDMYLDGTLVEVRAMTASGSAKICERLVSAIPGLNNYPVQLADLVRKRWEFAIKRALLQSVPNAPPKSPPNGVLRRKDNKIFWEPNPALATMANAKGIAPMDWIRGYLDFYGIDIPDGDAAALWESCKFNSEESIIVAVIDTMSEQAGLADYSLDRGDARKEIDRRLEPKRPRPKTAEPPVVTFVYPDESPGEGDIVVTIKGRGFTGVTAVKFGKHPAPESTIKLVSDTEFTVRTPEVAEGGVLSVIVTTPAGSSDGAQKVKFSKSAGGHGKAEDKTEVGASVMFVWSRKKPEHGEAKDASGVKFEGEYSIKIKRWGKWKFEVSAAKIQGSITFDSNGKVKGWEVLPGGEGGIAYEVVQDVVEAAISGGLAAGLAREAGENSKPWESKFVLEGSVGGKLEFSIGSRVKLVFQAEASLSEQFGKQTEFEHGWGVGAGFKVKFK